MQQYPESDFFFFFYLPLRQYFRSQKEKPTDHNRCSPFTAEIYAKRDRERAKQAGKSQ